VEKIHFLTPIFQHPFWFFVSQNHGKVKSGIVIQAMKNQHQRLSIVQHFVFISQFFDQSWNERCSSTPIMTSIVLGIDHSSFMTIDIM
jgi:hypothetical protein